MHVESGSYYLLFYYFSTVLFHYLLITIHCFTLPFYHSTTTPAVCISETEPCMLSQDFTIFLFQNFRTVLLHYLLFYYLRLYYFYYSTTTPAVCFSQIDLCRLSFEISVLYYSTIHYFTILLFYHDPSRLHLGNRAVSSASFCLHLETPALHVAPQSPRASRKGLHLENRPCAC